MALRPAGELHQCRDTAARQRPLDLAPRRAARLDSARLDSAGLDSARLDSARLDSARLDRHRVLAAGLDSAGLDPAWARFRSARSRSARSRLARSTCSSRRSVPIPLGSIPLGSIPVLFTCTPTCPSGGVLRDHLAQLRPNLTLENLMRAVGTAGSAPSTSPTSCSGSPRRPSMTTPCESSSRRSC